MTAPVTINSTSPVHALAVLMFLNRKPPQIVEPARLWSEAIAAGLVVC